MIIRKITLGFVIQEIDVDLESRSCKIISQEFVAGDSDWETPLDGEILSEAAVDSLFSDFENGVPYFPFTMGDIK